MAQKKSTTSITNKVSFGKRKGGKASKTLNKSNKKGRKKYKGQGR